MQVAAGVALRLGGDDVELNALVEAILRVHATMRTTMDVSVAVTPRAGTWGGAYIGHDLLQDDLTRLRGWNVHQQAPGHAAKDGLVKVEPAQRQQRKASQAQGKQHAPQASTATYGRLVAPMTITRSLPVPRPSHSVISTVCTLR